jgi:HAD superfamily hydrolase (TIGR01509 family)
MAVVFDFDGVLADTERLHLSAFQDVFAARGWTLDEDTYFSRYLGYDDDDLVATFARERRLGLDRREIDAVVRAKGERYRERLGGAAALFPGAVACVRRLGARFPLGIASGSLRAEIEAILVASGLGGAFRVIIGADDVTDSKPAPDPYLAAVGRLGVAPERALAVEDSLWGLESAREAGLHTVAVSTSFPAAALDGADVVIASLDELTVELADRVLNG